VQQLRRRRHVPQLLQAAQRARQRRRLRGAGAAGGRRRALIQGVLRTNYIDWGFITMILPIRESGRRCRAQGVLHGESTVGRRDKRSALLNGTHTAPFVDCLFLSGCMQLAS